MAATGGGLYLHDLPAVSGQADQFGPQGRGRSVRQVITTEANAESFCAWLRGYFVSNGQRPLMVEVGPWKPPRTVSQGAKIHAAIQELAQLAGYADWRGELKPAIKEAYYPHKQVPLGAEGHVLVPKSTSELTREEASEVIEKILMLASEMGFTLQGSTER